MNSSQIWSKTFRNIIDAYWYHLILKNVHRSKIHTITIKKLVWYYLFLKRAFPTRYIIIRNITGQLKAEVLLSKLRESRRSVYRDILFLRLLSLKLLFVFFIFEKLVFDFVVAPFSLVCFSLCWFDFSGEQCVQFRL